MSGSATLFEQERYFAFGQVDSDPFRLSESYRLRYQVYCLERGFLPTSAYPEYMETDAFDGCSVHFAAFDHDEEIAGAVRLVTHIDDLGYPFQKHCPLYSHVQLPPTTSACEVSRLVVSKAYRRRRDDNWLGISTNNGEDARGVDAKRGGHPIVVLGLYRAMYAYSLENNIRFWYAAMERSLARLLCRYGFDFHALGPEVDYHGPVTVYMADLRNLEANLAASNGELLRWLQCA